MIHIKRTKYFRGFRVVEGEEGLILDISYSTTRPSDKQDARQIELVRILLASSIALNEKPLRLREKLDTVFSANHSVCVDNVFARSATVHPQSAATPRGPTYRGSPPRQGAIKGVCVVLVATWR